MEQYTPEIVANCNNMIICKDGGLYDIHHGFRYLFNTFRTFICNKEFIKAIREFKSKPFYKRFKDDVTNQPQFQQLIRNYVGNDNAYTVQDLIEVILKNTDEYGRLNTHTQKEVHTFNPFIPGAIGLRRFVERHCYTGFPEIIGRLYQAGGNTYKHNDVTKIEELFSSISTILSGKPKEITTATTYFLDKQGLFKDDVRNKLEHYLNAGGILTVRPVINSQIQCDSFNVLSDINKDRKFGTIGANDSNGAFRSLEEAIKKNYGNNNTDFILNMPQEKDLERNTEKYYKYQNFIKNNPIYSSQYNNVNMNNNNYYGFNNNNNYHNANNNNNHHNANINNFHNYYNNFRSNLSSSSSSTQAGTNYNSNISGISNNPFYYHMQNQMNNMQNQVNMNMNNNNNNINNPFNPYYNNGLFGQPNNNMLNLNLGNNQNNQRGYGYNPQ